MTRLPSTLPCARPARRTPRAARHGVAALALALAATASAGQTAAPSPEPGASAAAGAPAPLPATLSLEQAVHTAHARSLQMQAQESAAAAARHLAVAAAQRPDPVLKAGIANLPTDGPDRWSLTRDFMTMRSIGVMQEFTRDDKRRARAARYEREAEVADAARGLAAATVQRETAVAWLDRHFQERMRTLLAALRDESRLQVEAAEAAYRGGRGPQADVLAARAAVVQVEDRLAQADRQAATATTMLARWVGDAARVPLAAAPAMDQVRVDVASLDSVLGHHPEVAMRAGQEAVARAEAEMARTERRGDWTAEVMFSQRGPAYSSMVSVNVSIPLPWNRADRQDREWQARLATAEQMRAEREDMTREHVAQTRALLLEWQSLRERLGRWDATLLPLAAERTRAALAAYRGASGPLAGVLEARRMEIDARMERLRLEMDAARLWAQLRFLVPEAHEPAHDTAAPPARP